jgi:hypothetical protein
VKKLLAGCLIILVLGVVAFVAGSYFLYRAASPMIQNAREFLAGATELEQLEKQITNQSPFAPPASNELSEAQVQRFVRVQENVRNTLGQRVEEIEAKYKHLKGNQQGELSVTEAFTAFSEMINVFVQARRVQVAALNQENFSQEEYAWVRDRVFQAAGYEVASQIDFRKIEEAIRQGTGGSLGDLEAPDLPKVDVPEKNRALVKPHAAKMGEWLPLAFFGL